MLDTMKHFLNTWGQNGLLAAIIGPLIGALLTLIAVFFRQIGYFFKWLWIRGRAITSKRGKDDAFERVYLNWIVSQYRYLGLLPARVVAARWGEEGRNVDLEKVYVSLHISAQGGDKNSIETSTRNSSSWRKQSWFYAALKNTLWFYMFFAIPLIILSLFGAVATFFHYPLVIESAIIIPLIIVCTLLVFIKWRVARREETYQLGDLALAIDTHKQLVVRGDPGSGKTTLLRYLAVTCARGLRSSKKYGDVPNIVKKRLLWTTRPFPILVTLRRYSTVALWTQEKRLIDVFVDEMSSELQKRCPEGFFERKLAKGNCLILLDAFDELGSPEARTAMARRIEDFLSIYDQPRNRVIVTTRIVGYEGQLDRYGFQIRTVQHLNVGEVRALIKQRYNAIALSETAHWKLQDAAPIQQDMRRRSERLIKKIESTPRLAQLATNPLLLSLIVLVHRVKLELPEERVQLYRECVEILTEQWQSFKRAESDLQPGVQEELNLSQKLVLLQALALNMQQQREEEDRQTLLPQLQAQKIIADKLPDILGSQLPVSEDERREVCRRKAITWVKGIQAESGILVEQGLDETGDPLIGFSHLTFQEYLAAVAINETSSQQHLLTSHLLQPAWREVVLLYVALTSDATSIIAQLLDTSQQPAGIVLAGFCLAEKVKHVKNEVQHLTLTKLKAGFEQADDSMVKTFGPVLAAIGGSEVTTFMRGQLHSIIAVKRLEAIKALGQIKPSDPLMKDVQKDLVQLLETPNDVTLMIATREALAHIGDPRFTGKEPIVVSISQQTESIPSSPKGWKEFLASPEWIRAKKLRQKLSLITRVFDYWCFTKFHRLRQQVPHKHAFTIGKYPVTTIEYARFIEATEHRTPKYWREGTYSPEKATHPVAGITMKDAKAYCKWLSKETKETYRLPTEWEWEWAATGSLGRRYPWGEQFDKDKCNTKDAAIGETTPVGSYLSGTNQYDLTDMVGNIWELTEGYFFSPYLYFLPFLYIFFVFLYFLLILPFFYALFYLLLTLLLIYSPLLLFTSFLSLFFPPSSFSANILRGGAFDTSSDQATCFFRKIDSRVHANVGFRCVKEI